MERAYVRPAGALAARASSRFGRRLPLLLLLAAAFALAPGSAEAVVAFDQGSSTQVNDLSVLTWSHTVSVGETRAMVVGVSVRSAGEWVLSATYAGQPLTQLGLANSSGSTASMELWGMVNPPVGTANVIVTLNTTSNAVAGAASFTGVDPAVPFGPFVSLSGTDVTSSIVVPAAAGDMVVDTISVKGGGTGAAPGAGQAQRWFGSTGTTGNDVGGSGSTEPAAGATTMTWNWASNNSFATGAVAVKAAQADMVVTKTDGVTSAIAGSDLTYTIVVLNNGPSDFEDGTLVDTFDPTFFDVAGITWTCAITSGSGNCDDPSGTGNISTTMDLAGGSEATYTVTAPILSGATGTISNTATVAMPPGFLDLAPANNTSTDNDTVLGRETDLAVTKSDATTSHVAGTNLVYSVVVTNNGPSDMDDATVADTLDPTFFNVPGSSWTCAVTSGTGNCDAASGTGNLSSTVDLTLGSEATYTITAPVLSGATGTISNTASVTVEAGTTDPALGDNSATDADTALTRTADVGISKTDGTAVHVAGTDLTYTIVVTNNGPSDVDDAAVADTFDPAVFNVPGVSWTCAITSGTGNCDAASGTGNIATTVDLTLGSQATYTVTAPTLTNATGTITNTATVTAPAGTTDPSAANDSGSDTDTVLARESDLAITKTDGVVSHTAGTNLTYTLVVTNAGPSDVDDATVADTFDPGVFNVPGVSWTCAITSGTGNCDAASGTGDLSTTADLALGGEATYTITAPVLSGATGTITNTATVTEPAGTLDPVAADNSATDNDTVLGRSSDLAITKTDGTAAHIAGTDLTYTIVVTNSGPSDTDDATVADTFDPGVFNVPGVSWTCAVTSGTGNCDAASGTGDLSTTVDLTLGSEATYTVTAPVLSGATGTISNTATITEPAGTTDPTAGNNSASDADTVLGRSADLAISKTDGTTLHGAGTDLTYTIVVTNNGPSDVDDATVADTFDPGVFNVPGVSWTCAITTGTGNCDAASGSGDLSTTVDLTLGSQATYTVTAPVLSGATGTVSNTATVTEPAGTADPSAANNSDSDTDTVLVRQADLSVGKTDGVVSHVAGTNLTYTIVVGNSGPSDVDDATVADTFDPAVFNVAGVSWTCAITAGSGNCDVASGSGNLSTTVDLTLGSQATYTVTAPVLSGATGTITNTATVTEPAGTMDPVAADNTSTDNDTVLGRTADLAINKTDGTASHIAGTDLTYTIVVTNNGPSDVDDATVADTFDPAIFDVPGVSWTCAITSGTGNCDAASGSGDLSTTVDLTLGAEATYTVTAPVLSVATGTINNTATVTAPGGTTDPTAANDSATDNNTVLSRQADLSISKTDGVTSHVAGTNLTYTIVVTNSGPSDVDDATVADTFDPTFFDVPGVSWTCAITTGSGNCDAASGTGDISTTLDLTDGSQATYTVTAPVLSIATGTISNTATVTEPAETADPAGANNTSTDNDTVLGREADLAITKTDGTVSHTAGTDLTYTIVVTNNGPSDVDDAAVADTFDPSFFNVAGISWTCAITSGTGNCDEASSTGDISTTVDLTTGSQATYTVTAPVLSIATGTISNTATVTEPAGTVDPAAGNNAATDGDTVLGRTADLAIVKTDLATAHIAGTDLTYTIVVTNNGPSDVDDALVSDTFDPGVFQVAGITWTCAITAGTGNCDSSSGTGDLSTTVDLTSGSEATFTIVAPTLSVATGTISNTATVTEPAGTLDPVGGNNSSTDNDTVLGRQADLAISKTDGTTSHVPGTTLSYTIVVTNNGPSDVDAAAVADTFDPGVFDVPSVSWACAITSGSGNCDAASGTGDISTTLDLTVGSQATYTVTAPVLSAATGTITNTATVTEPAGTVDPAAGNNAATDNDTVLGRQADLAVSKTDGTTSHVPGTNLSYTIVVTNNGPSDVDDAAVADTFDPAMFNVPGVSWSCAITSGSGNCDSASGTGDIATTVDLTVGSEATYTVTAPVLSIATGTITNTATATAPVGTPDPVGGNNSATDNDTALGRQADLAISKTDGATAHVPGTNLTYTIVVTNNGPSDVNDAAVADTFDPGVFDVPGVSWSCAVTSGSGNCDAASGTGDLSTTVDLTVGSQATYTVTAPVQSAATGTITNTATVTEPAGTGDPAAGNNSATDNDTVLGRQADLTISKTDGTTSHVAGTDLTYTIVVTNNGPSDVDDATVADTLDPAVFDVPSVSWSCAITSGSGNCDAVSGSGDLSATVDLTTGSQATYTVTGPVQSVATGTISNTAIVTEPAGTTDPAAGNNSATDDNTVLGREADLAISKTDGIGAHIPGTDLTYTIVVTNNGPSDVDDAAVADTFDPAMFDVPGVAWTCTITSGSGNCDDASGTGDMATTVDLTVGSQATYTVTAPVLSVATGTINNTATVAAPPGTSDLVPGNDSATDNDTVLGRQADLAITKTDGVTGHTPGTDLTYTIVVTNSGPSDVDDAAVADTFDPAMFDVPGVSWTCAVTTGTGNCDDASGTGDIATTVDLTTGSEATYTVTAPVLSAATGTISNTATVTAPAGTGDPALADNTATDADTVLGRSADLDVVVTDGVTSATPGTNLTYTVTVTNNGPSDVDDASLADVFDPGTFNVPGVTWSCVISSGSGNCDDASGSGDIGTTVDLTVGSQATYTVTAPLLSSVTGTISNTATITEPAGTADPVAANNSSTDADTAMSRQADLAITNTDSTTTAVPGTNLNYVITVTNNGPSDVDDASVADVFDPAIFDVPGISWSCAISSGTGNCDQANGTGDLAATIDLTLGSEATFIVTAPILSGATGTIVNTATVTEPVGTTDPATGNNSATDNDTGLGREVDLAITKTDGVTSGTPGNSLTYTIVVTNNGPSDVDDAIVMDTFDPAIFDVPNVGWTCAITTGSGNCDTASGTGDINTTVDLTFGSEATFTATAPILPGATGTVSNTATVDAPGGKTDPQLSNNAATDNDTVLVAVGDVSLALAVNNPTPNVGSQVVFTFDVTNAGPSHATGVVVSAPIPAGYSYVSDDAGGSYDSGTGLWTVGTLVDAGSASLNITVDVNPAGSYTQEAEVWAMTEADPDSTPGNGIGQGEDDEASLTTVPVPIADLSLAMTVSDTRPLIGYDLSFTVTLSNAGPSPATGVVVRDMLPSGYTYVSDNTARTGTTYAAGLWDVGTLAAGDSIDLILTVTANGSGEYLNEAEVSAANELDPDSAPDNGSLTEDDYAQLETQPNSDVIALTKRAGERDITGGASLEYVITAQNMTSSTQFDVSVSDRIPAGFKYVEDSAQIVRAGNDGILGTPDDDVSPINTSGSRPISFGPFDLVTDEQVLIRYVLRVGAGVAPGEHTNTATPYVGVLNAGSSATATVTVIADPVFDRSIVIGKVFHDRNGNGLQDPGDNGIAGAMVAMDNGVYALTDAEGRYSIPGVLPGQRLIKLNTNSLAAGSTMTTDVSKVMWVSPGLMSKANFGVKTNLETESIGERAIPSLKVDTLRKDLPIEVVGNAETLSLVVNGENIPLPSGGVELGVASVDSAIRLNAGQLTEPIQFDLEAPASANVSEWELVITDGDDQPVQEFNGAGTPPESIAWDGLTQRGERIQSGQVYGYQLSTTLDDGTRVASGQQLVGVDRSSVIALNLTDEAFEEGSAKLSRSARTALEAAARILKQFPEETVVVGGPADAAGQDAGLSQQRAEAATSFLVANLDLSPDQFVSMGLGRPVPSSAASEEFVDAKWGEPQVRINGADVAIENQGRFRSTLAEDTTEALSIQMANSVGRSVDVDMPVPTLQLTGPDGTFLLGKGESTHRCTDGDAGAVRCWNECTATESGEVSCWIEGRTDPGNTVELDEEPVELDADGYFVAELPLEPGLNRFGVVARNPAGLTRLINLNLEVSDKDGDGNPLIQGQNIPTLTMQLPPDGTRLGTAVYPVRGKTEPGNRIAVNGTEIEIAQDGSFDQEVELPRGSTQMVVQVTDPNGDVGTLSRDLEVAKNEIFLVAFADGKFGQMSTDGAVEAAGLNGEDDFFTEGRVAYYLKGVIKGKYLITSAFDSGATGLFNDLGDTAENDLLTNLDPDRYYPVYGDNSTVVFDAQSEGKFYLALDGDTIHAVIGNYPLSLTDTELSAYQRTLYGGRFVYESLSRTKYGQPDTMAVVFGAQVDQVHVRDQLRATGGSLYYLSHRDVIMGSEEINIVVRDKNTGLILSRTRQRQAADYTIKYIEGRIMFHRPVSSVAASTAVVDRSVLAGHPVFIEVDYETRTDDFEKTSSGGRVRQQVNDNVAVGATYINDELSAGEYSLAGVDTEVRLGKNTRLTAELSESEGSDSMVMLSQDGGLTYNPVAVNGLEQGSAWRVAADLDVGEWFGKPDRYQVNLYMKEIEPGFFSRGNTLEQGTDKAGINARIKVGDTDTVIVNHAQETREGTGALPQAVSDRTSSSVTWEHVEDRWGVTGQVQQDDITDSTGQSLESTISAGRFWYRVSDKVTARLEHQQTFSSPDNSRTRAGIQYQITDTLALDTGVSVGDQGASAEAGLVYQNGDSTIYVSERMAEDPTGASRSTTVLGARSPIGPGRTVYSEYQRENTPTGEQSVSLVGAQQTWDLQPGLKVLLSGELGNVNSTSLQQDRSAVSAGVTFGHPSGLSATSRLELRQLESNNGDNDLQWFTFTKMDYQINPSTQLYFKYSFSRSNDELTSRTNAELEEQSLGLAFRPVANDRFNAIGRLTRLSDSRPSVLTGTKSGERSLDVFAVETSYQITRRLEWAAKLAAKRELRTFESIPDVQTDSLLTVQRMNINVWKPINLGVEYRILSQVQTDDQRQGMLGEVMWNLHKQMRLGVGYNFTDFSDNELSQNDYSVHGWFFRVQGKY